jgi:hypothetical protein
MHAKERGEKGVLRVDDEQILTIAIDSCGDWVTEDLLNDAISSLRDSGLARSTRDALAGIFHKIDATALPALIKTASQEMRKIEAGMKDGDLTVMEQGRFPAVDALGDHPTFERYYDFGDEWLKRALRRVEAGYSRKNNSDSNETRAQHTSRESNNWSILPHHFVLSETSRVELLEKLTEVEKRLEQIDLGNAERAQVRSYVLSAQILTDSPDPPVDLIWELIGRANSVAGIASLFVSVIALFT